METIIDNKNVTVVDPRLAMGKMTYATKNKPYYIIYTSNYYENIILDSLLELLSKDMAKCVKRWSRGNFIDDNYGRPYKIGTIDCSIWDLRGVFGITKPLTDFLDYETIAFLDGEISQLI